MNLKIKSMPALVLLAALMTQSIIADVFLIPITHINDKVHYLFVRYRNIDNGNYWQLIRGKAFNQGHLKNASQDQMLDLAFRTTQDANYKNPREIDYMPFNKPAADGSQLAAVEVPYMSGKDLYTKNVNKNQYVQVLDFAWIPIDELLNSFQTGKPVERNGKPISVGIAAMLKGFMIRPPQAQAVAALTPSTIEFYDNNKPFYAFTNFYPATFSAPVFSTRQQKFVGNPLPWKTSEHFFQAHKFVDEHGRITNQQAFQAVLNSQNPRDAFNLARAANSSKRLDWEAAANAGLLVKDLIMSAALEKKFANPALKSQLLATGDAQLVEASPVDPYWGKGAGYGQSGSGKNMLGQLLMALRKKLKTQ